MNIHPCRCTDYNGGQCYNCLNGFHRGCEKRCRTKNAKVPGLVIVTRPKAKPHEHKWIGTPADESKGKPFYYYCACGETTGRRATRTRRPNK